MNLKSVYNENLCWRDASLQSVITGKIHNALVQDGEKPHDFEAAFEVVGEILTNIIEQVAKSEAEALTMAGGEWELDARTDDELLAS